MCSCSLLRAAANETDTGTCYSLNSRPFVACRRLITSSNTSKIYTMACRKVSIFFLGEIQLSWKSCSQHSISSNPASQITFLLSSILTYCTSRVNPVLLPFHKDSRQPCQWQQWNWNTVFVPGKNHPLDILQPFFPHHGHTFCDGYEHPSIGPRALSSLPPFQHRPSFRKTILICFFYEYGFALPGTPPWLPLSYKPLRATAACMLWWILLDNRHTHSVSSFCRGLWSGKRDLCRC